MSEWTIYHPAIKLETVLLKVGNASRHLLSFSPPVRTVINNKVGYGCILKSRTLMSLCPAVELLDSCGVFGKHGQTREQVSLPTVRQVCNPNTGYFIFLIYLFLPYLRLPDC